MREQEMAVNVAKQIYFDEFNLFYKIAERSIEDTNSKDVFNEACTVHEITEEFISRLNKCNSYTKDGMYRVVVKSLNRIEYHLNDIEIDCYLEYFEKIIDEILKQVVVLGGGD